MKLKSVISRNSVAAASVLTLALLASAAHAQTATLALSYLLSSTGSDGAYPYGGVIQATDGNLYGVTQEGGTGNNGTAFRITPAGVYSVVHTFAGGTKDGANPNALIELPDGNLYGTTEYGGTLNRGTLFKMTLSGTMTILYNFTNQNTDGDNPYGNIIFDGTYIYGTTFANDSDSANYGTLYKYKPNLGNGTSGPTVILLFDNSANADFGEFPWDGVTDINGVLYGTSNEGGGNFNCGALFSAAINGDNNQVLHTFTGGLDGCLSYAAPRYWTDGNLYGTTNVGASGGGVYHSGLEPDELTFNTTLAGNPDGIVSFDGTGSLLFLTADGGTASQGSLVQMTPAAAEPDDPNPVTTLYSFPASGAPGAQSDTDPFIDNRGRVWTEQYDGGTLTGSGESSGPGAIAVFNVSSVSGPPLTITATPSTVQAGNSSTIAWQAINAFSTNEQYCFASGNSNAKWQGAQTGTYSEGTYSGSQTVSFGTPGAYSFAINCGGTQTAFVTLTVTPPGTATTLTANPTPVQYGKTVTLTATVKKASGTGAPTGTVKFEFIGNVLDTSALNGSGVATYTISTIGLPEGTYPLTAVYSGDTGDAASTSPATNVVIVKDTTSTTLTSSANPDTIGTSVTFTATVSPSTATGSVTFQLGTSPIETVTLGGGKATLTIPTSALPTGTYPIDAVYEGDTNDQGSTSNIVEQNLQK